MQREMNETPPEYNFAGMTVFSSTFGGREAAVILEAEIADDGPPRRPAAHLRQVPLPARLLFGTLPVSLAMLSLSIQPTHTPFPILRWPCAGPPPGARRGLNSRDDPACGGRGSSSPCVLRCSGVIVYMVQVRTRRR